ncbi:MAG: methylated-DNA--[protein]-cysteine S-methyltransferase [Chloroflexota bacterium]
MPAPPPITVSASLVGTALAAPWGLVHLAATEVGLVAVDLTAAEDDFRSGVERRLGRVMAWVPASELDTGGPDDRRHLLLAFRALTAALRGDEGDLDSLVLDLADRPAWDRTVLGAVRAIPRGETRSYGDIARAIGRAGAARAVGGAVGRNPIGFVIPCHRVIAGDGTLGGYGGGWWGDLDRLLAMKADLLAREGLTVRRGVSGTRRRR